ncbi:MAG: J domain-containing protein [Paludibacteraceae bacterium]|nr:J domain-containing protein [Paludibacteraceae bacterium]
MKYIYKDQVFLKEYKEVYLQTEDTFRAYCVIWAMATYVASLPAAGIAEYSENLAAAYVAFVAFFSVAIIIIIDQRRKKKFLSNYNKNKTEADNYYQFLTKDLVYAPLLQRACLMNPNAKKTQIELLKKWFFLDDDSISEYIFNEKDNDNEKRNDDEDNTIEQLKKEDLTYKRTFINRLFQLVILEDGIHNDEWKFMMQLITQLQFNKNYVNYFKERYEPLRTEFDEYEKRSNNSGNKYVYSLKEYYTTLGLDENATDEEVRRAYHELALQHHPDLPKNAGRTEECEKMMMKINEAYEKLRSKS